MDEIKKKQKRVNFFWIYAIASVFLLVTMVGFHSLWQILKGKEALFKVLYDQGEALVESLQSSGKNAIISNKLAQDILIDRLLDNARLIDLLIEYNGYNPILLKEITAKNNLFRVQVINQVGRVILDSLAPPFPVILNWWPHPGDILRLSLAPILRGEKYIVVEGGHQDQLTMNNLFWVAMARKNSQGAILIYVDAQYMEQFRQEVGLGKLIRDIADQEGIRYLSFQDLSLPNKNNFIVAPNNFFLPEVKGIYQLSKVTTNELTQANFQRLPSGEEVYEIIKPFIFRGRILGIFRVGLSLDKFTQTIRQAQKHNIWFSLLIIFLGSSGLAVIFFRQYVQYKRYNLLEENLQRSERLSSIGKLAAGVAHEIRNPLNAISMAIQRLQHEYLPEGEENKHEFIHFTNVIREEVKRVDKIIGYFLNFAREPKLEWQKIDITSLIKDLLFFLSSEAEKHQVKIDTNYSSSALPCCCDPNQLKQALINIIRNAFQAMPDGGTVTISLAQIKNNILISIQDTGVGIADTAKIFEIYYTTKEGGVGLGLPISQKIIEEHGGKIEVNSKVGEGSEFKIWLPVGENKL